MREAVEEQPFRAWQWLAGAALSAGMAAIEGVRIVPEAWRGELPNPDGAMRLVRLRDMLAAGHPLDVVARDGSGHGVLLHWSHLLDSLLLLLAAPLSFWLGWDGALRVVAVGFGPLCMGALGASLCWAVAPAAPWPSRAFAPIMAAASPVLVSYGLPGVVHHHVPLVLTVTMTAGWASRAVHQEIGAGARVGIWAAIGLWLSPETVPFSLATFAAMGLAWLAHPQHRPIASELRWAGSWFLVVTASAYAVDPPLVDASAVQFDRLSTVWVILAGACCLCGWFTWSGARWRWPIALAVLAGVAPVLAWLAAFPAVLAGPAALLSPDEAQAFFGIINEMRPLGAMEGLRHLSTGALALALAWRRSTATWAWVALCLLAVLALGTRHVRFGSYAATSGALALPVVLAWCGRTFGNRERLAPVLARPLVVLLFVAGSFVGGDAAATSGEGSSGRASFCSRGPSAEMLEPARGQVVLARPDEAPDLLYRTDVLTAGSLFHRAIAPFMRNRAAWRSAPSNTVPDAVRATEAGWVLLCPGAPRSKLVADLAPDTLEDRLRTGAAPPWLQAAGRDGSGWSLWKIVGVTAPAERH